MNYPLSLQTLIDELGRLPGIGPKSAQRLALWMTRQPDDDIRRLSEALTAMKDHLSFCPECCNIAEKDGLCPICSDVRRDQSIVCVVEESRDVSAIERSGAYSGKYHVLQGLINPLDGITPDRIRARELFARLHDESIREVILSLSPTVEGEATMMYLSRLLAPTGLRVTQVATGLPVGGDIEFADVQTIGRAIDLRRVVSEGHA